MTEEQYDSYLVGGAALPQQTASEGFPYSRARVFQAEAQNWINDGDSPVGVLAAPTGAGKTAVIASLAYDSDRVVCMYPTNALAEAQEEELKEEFGLDVDVLNGKTLTGTGDARSQEVLRYATDPAAGDVVLTNPDVLQAILQHKYFSPGSELMRFFAGFDAAVYDEFHYYDALGASGLLMQIKVMSERGSYQARDGSIELPRVLLPSATPATEFVDHLSEDIDLSARWIRSSLLPADVDDPGPATNVELVYRTPDEDDHLRQASSALEPEKGVEIEAAEEAVGSVPEGSQRFRYPMVVNRWRADVEESFGEIADVLQEATGLAESEQPSGRAAVIFNSAARSNRFQVYLEDTRDLGEFAVKDNGYDTAKDSSTSEDFAILNTTSKGEVGLDYDLDRLVMVAPYTATDFVQRIGRAARHSPAVVDVFGLDDLLWPTVQSYPNFLRRVTETLGDIHLDRLRLQNLAGLRAARAIKERESSVESHPADVIEDFHDFSRQATWRQFLEECDTALKTAQEPGGPFTPQLDRATAKTVEAVHESLKGLDSFRGRSIQHAIKYPAGANKEATEYDLVNALRHYRIEDVQDGRIQLAEGEAGQRIGRYLGDLSEGQGIDLSHSRYRTEQQLQQRTRDQVDSADFDVTNLSRNQVIEYLNTIELNSTILPREITTNCFKIKCSDEGEVEEIKDNTTENT